MKTFVPSAIVCQCGADTLSKDPLGEANLSLEGYLNCVKLVVGLRTPLVLLGGGKFSFKYFFAYILYSWKEINKL